MVAAEKLLKKSCAQLDCFHSPPFLAAHVLFVFVYCEFVTCSFLESMDVHAIAVSSSWLDDAARLHCNAAVRSRHLGILQACSKV